MIYYNIIFKDDIVSSIQSSAIQSEEYIYNDYVVERIKKHITTKDDVITLLNEYNQLELQRIEAERLKQEEETRLEALRLQEQNENITKEEVGINETR